MATGGWLPYWTAQIWSPDEIQFWFFLAQNFVAGSIYLLWLHSRHIVSDGLSTWAVLRSTSGFSCCWSCLPKIPANLQLMVQWPSLAIDSIHYFINGGGLWVFLILSFFLEFYYKENFPINYLSWGTVYIGRKG